MKFIKLCSALVFLSVVSFYFIGCSSAEQTTAKLAYSQGDYKKAEIEFDKETKQNPQNEEAWFYLAMSRAKQGKVEGVKTAMEQYRKIGKNSFRSELTQEWGAQYDKGYKFYEEGERNAKAGKDDEAIKSFQNSLISFETAYAILPDSAFVKDNINAINGRINTIAVKPIIDKGVEFEKQGNFDAAINEYKKGLDKVTKGSGAYEVIIYNLGLANLKWGEEMRKTNQDDPAYKTKYETALPYLEELTSSTNKENKLNAYEMLVQVYGNLGMTDKAMDAMKIRDELKKENK
jgi:tetratricopeptide (TPR) repeat protein